jgi:tetratricopeptide (TPR) repeat protein
VFKSPFIVFVSVTALFLQGLQVISAEPGERMSASVSSVNTSQALTPYAREGENALRMGDFETAERVFREGINNFKMSGPEAPKALAELHLGLGESYLWAGKFPEANSELNKVLPQIKKNFGLDSAMTARALDSLGWLQQGTAKGDKGEDLTRQALEIRKKILPGNSGELAESYEHLGELLQQKGLFDEAAKSYEQALLVRKNTAGPWSMAVANDLEELAACDQHRGKYDESLNLLKGALQLKEMQEAVFKPYARRNVDDSVVFRFLPGSPNCSRDMSDGNLTERITANGITVVASMTQKPSDFVKTLRATIGIQNSSQKPIDILAHPPTMVVMAPKVRLAHMLSAEEVANQIEKKGDSKAKWIKFWGEGATTSYTTTVNSFGYDNNRYYGGGGNRYYIPNQYGYMPTPFGYPQPGWNWNRNRGNYNNNYGNMTTMTTQVPDWEARARALQKAQEVQSKSANDAADTRQNALGPSRIAPGQQLYGTVDFDDSKFTKALVRIPVGDATFEFAFDR